MSDFNKREYDKQYIKNNYEQIRLSVRKEDKASFDAFCTKIGVKPTQYITNLINADAIARGYDPIFASDRRRKQGKESNDNNNIE